MTSATSWLLLALLISLLFVSPAAAFGAGEIPDGNDFKGYLWRHGDIIDVLKYLPVSFATNHHFTKLQRKQVYFGNWLRDFSQVIDTTCLETIPEPLLRAVVSIMGFLEFGFATDEFDVTRERLGCYRHEEHIDNPRGYQDNAKEVDQRLRGPVDPEELEFDSKTGMKNYIANSGQGWDTSADYIRSQLTQCIEKGRLGRKRDPSSRKEAMIHLGAALHTLEDFAAHSNYTELVLNELGEDKVFCLVGDACRVKTPTGEEVSPLTTGTFGMLDIFQSLLGEADDMAILQSKGGLGELENKLRYGELAFNQIFDLVKTAVEAVSEFTQDKLPVLQQLETVSKIAAKVQKEPSSGEDLKHELFSDPNALWQSIEPVFYIHDRIAKWLQEEDEGSDDDAASMNSVDTTGGKLGEYSDELVFKFLGLFVESTLKEWRNAVRAAKEKVDNEAAQSTSAEVFQPESAASDPSHSDLSKDHYSHVLNCPAGRLATVTTNWTTQRIVRCWDDEKLSIDKTIDSILEILHHPSFPKKKTEIQDFMFQAVESWWASHSEDEKTKLREQLSKTSVQNRGHEHHQLSAKDFEGKTRGYAEFTGSRPKIKKPPRPRPVFDSVKNEVVQDFKYAAELAQKGYKDPVGAASDVAGGVIVLVTGTVKTVIRLPLLAIRTVRFIFGRVWNRRSNRAEEEN